MKSPSPMANTLSNTHHVLQPFCGTSTNWAKFVEAGSFPQHEHFRAKNLWWQKAPLAQIQLRRFHYFHLRVLALADLFPEHETVASLAPAMEGDETLRLLNRDGLVDG